MRFFLTTEYDFNTKTWMSAGYCMHTGMCLQKYAEYVTYTLMSYYDFILHTEFIKLDTYFDVIL